MILAVETATDICSVALLDDDGRIVAIQEELRPRAHSEMLATLIQNVLMEHGITAADLKAVAVSAGPGSYTGLRIGVSTAKAICFTTGAYLIGVPTLNGLAHAARDYIGKDDLLLTVLPSRRNEVHIAAFGGSEAHTMIHPPTSLTLNELPESEWLPDVAGRLYTAGPAAGDIMEFIPDEAILLDHSHVRPSAGHIGALAKIRLDNEDWDDLASFEPDYLKPFIPGPARPIFGSPRTTTS